MRIFHIVERMIIAILFGAMIKQNMLTYIKLIMFLRILNNIILHLSTYLLVFGGIIWSQILFETIFICWIANVYIHIVTTPTQPQLNSKVVFDMKMTLNHHQPHKLNNLDISAFPNQILTKL